MINTTKITSFSNFLSKIPSELIAYFENIEKYSEFQKNLKNLQKHLPYKKNNIKLSRKKGKPITSLYLKGKTKCRTTLIFEKTQNQANLVIHNGTSNSCNFEELKNIIKKYFSTNLTIQLWDWDLHKDYKQTIVIYQIFSKKIFDYKLIYWLCEKNSGCLMSGLINKIPNIYSWSLDKKKLFFQCNWKAMPISQKTLSYIKQLKSNIKNLIIC